MIERAMLAGAILPVAVVLWSGLLHGYERSVDQQIFGAVFLFFAYSVLLAGFQATSSAMEPAASCRWIPLVRITQRRIFWAQRSLKTALVSAPIAIVAAFLAQSVGLDLTPLVPIACIAPVWLFTLFHWLYRTENVLPERLLRLIFSRSFGPRADGQPIQLPEEWIIGARPYLMLVAGGQVESYLELRFGLFNVIHIDKCLTRYIMDPGLHSALRRFVAALAKLDSAVALKPSLQQSNLLVRCKHWQDVVDTAKVVLLAADSRRSGAAV